jgi:hypothetical protein
MNKRKGGAEKERIRKKTRLENDAQKYKKLTNMFATSSSTNSIVNISMADVATTEIITDLHPICDAADAVLLLSPNEAEAHDSKIETSDSFDDNAVNSTSYPNSDIQYKLNSNQCEPSEETQNNYNYFLKPPADCLKSFFKFHPKQNNFDLNVKINYQNVYFRNNKPRHWLTYDENTQKLFCSFCLAFSKASDKSTFISGYNITNSKHIYQRISEHESSALHAACTESYVLKINAKDIVSIYTRRHAEEVKKNRLILERIIETLKVIGKRGLSYRGAEESGYTLLDDSVDHGNFLEILLLVGKFDPLLEAHIEEVVRKSKSRHDSVGNSRGRGDLVTFLSKTTVNKVIDAITTSLTSMMVEEIREAGMFSVQIDTTQDINVQDQCSIVIRYVTETVHERVISIVNCTSTTGKGMCDLVCGVFEKVGIDVSKCIGNATDGASNMQGQYNGFNAWLNTVSPGQIHVWCYAHVLNLVMGDVTKKAVEVVTLFGVLNTCAVFLRESYLRFNVWREFSKLKYISVIGETRWWAKDRALTKIFGNFFIKTSDEETQVIDFLYIDMLQTFHDISTSNKFNNDVRYRAKALLDSLTSFEFILTAQLFLKVFEHTTPLSEYLQTTGMDILRAYKMVQDSINELSKVDRNFDSIFQAATNFSELANSELGKRNLDIEVQTGLKEKRIRANQPLESAKDKFRVNVHNMVMDQVINSLKQRFSEHGSLYADLSCLDPRNFAEILKRMPSDALQHLSGLLRKFDDSVTKDQLQTELLDFARKWESFETTLEDEYNLLFDTEVSDSVSDNIRQSESVEFETVFTIPAVENSDSHRNKCKSCKKCIVCCYFVLQKFNLHSLAYSNLFLAYKFVLTLSSSQVACERSFSKLKYILNRLRNLLSQSSLQSFMLMSCEKDLLPRINNNEIIDVLASTSETMKKLLY